MPYQLDGTRLEDKRVRWLYEPGSLTPAARIERGKLHYTISDHQGTVREIFDEQGERIWSQRLGTWGEAEITPAPSHYPDHHVDCNFRFLGQYFDEETQLHYNRHRYFSPETGQYISPDPIGLAGGFNPYSYVHNPAKWVDPYGLAGSVGNKGELFSNKSYTEIEKAPLEKWIVDSFKDGQYKTVVTTQDTYVYRVYGGKAKADGSFVSDLPTFDRIQAKIDAALLPEWKNTREFESKILVPKGTTLHVGKVAEQKTMSGTILEGGATQILLPRGWDQSWIQNVRSVPIKPSK